MVQFADALVLAIVATSTIAPVLALPAPIAESENVLEVRARARVRMPSGKKVGSSPKPKHKPSAPAPAKKSTGRALSKAGHIINGLVVATGVGATVAGVVNTYNSNKAKEEPAPEAQAREFDDEIDFFVREFNDEVELEARAPPARSSALKMPSGRAFSKTGHIMKGLIVATGVGARVFKVVNNKKKSAPPPPPQEEQQQQQQQPREYVDEVDYFARDFDDEELEARNILAKLGHGASRALGHAGTLAGIASTVQSIVRPPVYRRELDDEFDLMAREYFYDELE